MYNSSRSSPVDFCSEEGREMMIDSENTGGLVLQQMLFTESSGDDHETRMPRKRAETWVMEEVGSLINFRRELEDFFNTSKSNKLLWEKISAKMREKGFDRSPSMCTEKWRNLLKEFKKVRGRDMGIGSGKVSYCNELEEFYRERKRNAPNKNPSPPQIDPYMQFSERDNGMLTLNLEGRLDHDVPSLRLREVEAPVPSGSHPWNWRDTPGRGVEPETNSPYCGRVISVKLGEFTKRIGIDAGSDAIKESIKSALGIRTKRAFWLVDENDIVQSIDRNMPSGNYTLHLDKGLTIKICICDENQIPIHTEEKTFYTADDFRSFLSSRGWICLKDLTCYRNVETLDDLQPGEMYQGLRMIGH